jgi:hypothetical protein
MKVEEISVEEAEKEFQRRSYYKALLERVKANGKPVKVSGLTTSQVKGLYVAAKSYGIRAKGNYKDGYVVLVP